MQCPYSDFSIACLGEINQVKAELAREELALLDMLEESGIDCAQFFGNKSKDGDTDDPMLSDPQVREIVMFVINELDAEGKIFCKCDPRDNGRQYDAEILDEGVRVTCRKCGATRLIPTDSSLSAHAFLNDDALYLE